jgi:hypothetical protein
MNAAAELTERSAIENSVREIDGAKDYGSRREYDSDCKHPLQQPHANADQDIHRTPPVVTYAR